MQSAAEYVAGGEGMGTINEIGAGGHRRVGQLFTVFIRDVGDREAYGSAGRCYCFKYIALAELVFQDYFGAAVFYSDYVRGILAALLVFAAVAAYVSEFAEVESR